MKYKTEWIVGGFLFLSLLCFSSANVYASDAMGGKTYLLVIGINEYQYLPSMTSSVNNALLFAKTCERLGMRDSIVLIDSLATKERIKTELLKYQQRIRNGDHLVLYYSGHGGKNTMSWSSSNQSAQDNYHWRDDSLYDETIMPVDATFNKETQLTSRELAMILKKIPTQDITIIMESSYDESTSWTGQLPIFQSVNQTLRPRTSIRDLNMYGMNIIVSADWNEIAVNAVMDGKKQGAFTRYLTQGMLSGVADRNKDGKQTIREIFEYARLLTVQEVGIQHPQLYKGKNPDMIIIGK